MESTQPTRLTVAEVKRLHALLGGDALTEAMIIQFIGDRYGAPSLFELPWAVAAQVLRRHGDFIRAAKQHCQPELAIG
jgi:hypothetical protein